MLISEMFNYGKKICILCLGLKIACPSSSGVCVCVCVYVCVCGQAGVSIDRVHTQVTSPYREPKVLVETPAPQVLLVPR